jgi:hypothetical protein
VSGDYRRLLQELAVPRLVGSPDHARVRAALKRELEARRFIVLEQPVAVDRRTGPNRLVPVGAALAAAAIGSLVVSAVTPARGAVAGVVAAAALLAAAARAWPGGVPAAGVNLIGVRPRARVALWLAAHYDSKGQPLSMALRVVAVTLAAVGLVGLVWIAVARLLDTPAGRAAELSAAAAALIGGLLLFGNRVTNGSPGAVDNASALVTVLAVLDRLPADAPIGVLFPDAEEYGLLGARALVRERPNLLADTVVLNFDGIDDQGAAICFTHRPGSIVTAVADALSARQYRLLPVVVDGLAFRRAAGECATIMRGDWRTACLVHTRRDAAERLTLAGSEAVARAVAAALLPELVRVDAAREPA